MKKLITCAALCIAMFASLALSGCGHEHTSSDGWQCDRESHWCECSECGKTYDKGKHNFKEDEICPVCRSFVYENGDNSYSIYSYDEYGSLVHSVDYDPSGSLICYTRYEIEYYDDGNVKHTKEYMYDILNESGAEYLYYESAYLPCENAEPGEFYLCSDTFYNEDGSYTAYEYDENLNVLNSTQCDSDGSVITADRYEYELNENGELKKQTMYSNDVKYREVFYSYDEEGSQYESKYVYYDEDGKVSREHKYDASGNEID